MDKAPVFLSVVDNPELHRESIDIEVQEKKAVIESNVMLNEAAKKVDEGDSDGARSIIRKALGALRSSPAASAPSVQEEMELAEEYSRRIDGMDVMAPEEVKEMQKDQRFRIYQELHQN